MVGFDDVDGCCVNITSRWRQDILDLQDRSECQTDPIQVENVGVQSVMCKEQECQTSQELEGEKEGKHAEEDEEDEDTTFEGLADDDDLARFIENIGPLMLHELGRNEQSQAFISTFQEQGADDGGKDWTMLHTISRPTGNVEEDDDLGCTSIAWNATGSQVLASYGRFDNFGWCKHRGSVCIWNMFARGFSTTNAQDGTPYSPPPDIRLDAPSGLMCVAPHPCKPSVVAAGSFNGEVMVWDTVRQDRGEDTMIGCSQIEDYSHREPVLQLAWVRDSRHSSSRSGASSERYLLVSISGEGRTLFWDLANGLSAPLRGFTLAKDSRSAKPLGGTTLSFSCAAGASSTNVIVGSEGGHVSRCTMDLSSKKSGLKALMNEANIDRWTRDALDILIQVPEKDRFILKRNVERFVAKSTEVHDILPKHIYEASRSDSSMFPSAIRFSFKPHVGTVNSVDCSPFHRHGFISCGSDGHLCLYSTLETEPAMTFSPTTSGNYLLSACWSPHRPAVFACSSSSGELYVFDLADNQTSPVANIPAGGEKSQNPVYSIAFNKKTRGLLAAGDIKGSIRIFKLSWKLSNKQSV
eukprot:CAMPEP_0203765024 /NCGR_PEP_ID=MMETSP0098-20131031/18187_1 /ASSEMBLY_ACC=CAM_ASM_000208 /TAXON_ID=96639 /ORGANISM=" , Strain NY0313808BC1" /LENGTH=580 /DNA_ID=CAMNT_0050661239 /DNA_START=538 /DNA_END=2277 /DNA_ORIENTATION=+